MSFTYVTYSVLTYLTWGLQVFESAVFSALSIQILSVKLPFPTHNLREKSAIGSFFVTFSCKTWKCSHLSFLIFS